MVFDRILGQAPAVQTLKNALAQGRVHHAYRFEGQDGVGKELAALALAQSFVCTQQLQQGCGACAACLRAVRFSDEEPRVPQHPDVILVGRGLYPASVVGSKEASGISVEQIRRVVLSRIGFTPHEARAVTIIIRDADELTTAAANALLKTLEEPRPDVHFVLLTSRPNRLLDTIRSRTLAIRFGPLPDAVLSKILSDHGRPLSLLPLAEGSASRALELSDEENRGELQAFVTRMDQALAAPDLRVALDLAGDLPRDKFQLRERLLAFAQHIASTARAAASHAPHTAERKALQYSLVQSALEALERNVSPTLAVEGLLVEMRALHSSGAQ